MNRTQAVSTTAANVALVALCAAMIAMTAAGCAKKAAPEREPIPVKVEIVAGEAATPGQRYSATIEPDVQVDLAFKVGGYVDEIASVKGADGRTRLLQEGDAVAKGTVIARLRDAEYRDKVTEAKSSLTQAKADYERATQLYENHTLSKAEYDAALARMTSSQARVDQADLTLSDCSLKAPLDGLLMTRSVEVGTLVSPGVPAFVLADTRAVKAVVGLPDMAMDRLKIGQAQAITAEAFPGVAFQGTITRLSPSADPKSRMFEVECTIPNEDGRLKAGMISTFVLESAAAPAANASSPAVSMNAVVRPPGSKDGYAVYVVEEDGEKAIARSRLVKLGDVMGNRVAVLEGLSGGERVVVTGAANVADGLEVRVIP